MARVQLFCFPFAGGGGIAYKGLEDVVKNDVDVVLLDLPGRGRRIVEPLLETIPEMVEDLWQQIHHQVQAPCVFFGHSMGALLAYLLIQRMQDLNMPMPLHFFCTGYRAPSLGPARRDRHLLPRPAFVRLLAEMGGCPDEILQDPDALAFFEPIIRADLKAIETYHFESTVPLACPVTVIDGDNDALALGSRETWQKDVAKPIKQIVLPGNHFFIFDHWPAIGRCILDVVEAAYETY